jgi:hypothetical protein
MPGESERPQGYDDLLKLIDRLRQIRGAAPEKGSACQDLLAKLLPYADQPDYFAVRTPSLPGRDRPADTRH